VTLACYTSGVVTSKTTGGRSSSHLASRL